MYKVIHGFADMKDNGYVYRVGDKYPRLGFSVTESRIRELSSNTNRTGIPLIEKTGTRNSVAEVTEANTEQADEVIVKPRRSRKTAKNGE